ncbi:MAG: ammonium transporter [Saprospiraceae bacterium]
MKPTWIITFSILALIAVAGGFFAVDATPPAETSPINGADTAWMLISCALVLLMTPGLSFFYGGMVSFKNVVSTMLQSFICLGVVSFLWYLVGFSLAFGDSFGGLVGNPLTFFMFRNVGLHTHPGLAPTIPLLLFALFQLKFAIITPALITGSFAERVRFSGYLLFIVLFSLFIYAPLAHWTWNPDGFLRQWGVLDFAGGTVVHMSAGFAALAAVTVLGGRKNRPKNPLPANIPYVILGTGLLWFGWFGFNAGSALGATGTAVLAFGTTNMASASAMMTWVFFDAVRGKRITAMGACIGAVVGLVAITPAAGFVTIGQSFFIGFIAAIASNLTVSYFSRSGVDDTLDVFPCHGMGGIVGMLCTGIFAAGVGLIHGSTTTFLYHLLALVIVAVFTFGGSYILLKLTNAIIPLRVTGEQESMGLDISQHGENMTSLKERLKEFLGQKNGVEKRTAELV